MGQQKLAFQFTEAIGATEHPVGRPNRQRKRLLVGREPLAKLRQTYVQQGGPSPDKDTNRSWRRRG
jgi:hypothetical protein